MKKRPSKNILSTLFIPFTTLFVIVFILTAAFFVSSETIKIRKSTFLSIDNNLKNIMDGFDQMVSDLNTTSLNVAYSNLVKQRFSIYLGYSTSAIPEENYSSYQNNRILCDLLVAIIGPNNPVDQIYLYGLSGGCFGIGRDNTTSLKKVEDSPWYEKVDSTHGEKYIFLDKAEQLSPYFSYEEGSYFLTLCRKYYNSFNTSQGIIEVKKTMAPLAHTIDSYNRSYYENFFIVSPEGEIVYPLSASSASDTASQCPDFYEIIKDTSIVPKNLGVSFLKTSASQYILYQVSPESNFTSIAVVDKKDLLRPTYDYIFSAVIILLLVCAAIIILSYRIAQRISTPLGKIYSQLSSFEIDIDNLAEKEFTEIDTSIIELDGLYRAFLKMQSQTRASLKQQMELQNQEMQSRMLALQAQMNPHFLYNSLATIQAMADEDMTDEIYHMCQNMSDILRYISSNSNQLVNLSDELALTISYLECMKMRYDGQLSYSVSIPDNMMEIQIPKLCLQLIVENAIKFTTQKRSPWIVKLDGCITGDCWEIHILDNGPGFTEETLAELYQKILEIDEKGVLPNLEISGMGLMNVYIRFYLLYKKQRIFRLNNNEQEGACVTIGGLLS